MEDLKKDDSKTAAPATAGAEMSDEELWREMTGASEVEETDGVVDEPDPSDSAGDDPDEPSTPSGADGVKDDGDTDHDDPDKLREQIERLTQQVKSEKGRARGLNMKQERLQSDIRSLQAEIKALREAEADDATKEKISKAREEYGDVLDPVLESMERSDAATRRMADLRQERVDTLSRENEDFLKEQFDTFRAEHPTGVDFLQKHHEEFRNWVEDQPKTDREVYERNREAIVDGEAAALLLSKFKAHRAASDGGSRPETSPKDARRRQRQLAGAQSVRSPGTQVITSDNRPSDNADGQAHWDYWTKRNAR